MKSKIQSFMRFNPLLPVFFWILVFMVQYPIVNIAGLGSLGIFAMLFFVIYPILLFLIGVYFGQRYVEGALLYPLFPFVMFTAVSLFVFHDPAIVFGVAYFGISTIGLAVGAIARKVINYIKEKKYESTIK